MPDYTFIFFIRKDVLGELEILEEEDAMLEHGLSFFDEGKYDDYIEVRISAKDWREAKDKLKQYLPLIIKKLEE